MRGWPFSGIQREEEASLTGGGLFLVFSYFYFEHQKVLGRVGGSTREEGENSAFLCVWFSPGKETKAGER